MVLRLITYNLHKGFSFANRRFVLHEIRDGLRETGVDLVFLQEIHGEQQKHKGRVEQWPTESQFEFLADTVWSHYAYAKNAIYDHGHHGNAILSKYPIKYFQNINFSFLKQASRSLLHGIIQFPGFDSDLHAICVHLEWLRFEQQRQLRLVRTYINDNIPGNEPLILAGDFNDWRDNTRRIMEDELGLVEAFHLKYGKHAATFPSFWPIFKIDRIYFRGLELINCHCFSGAPWDRLSDHSPLYAELALN